MRYLWFIILFLFLWWVGKIFYGQYQTEQFCQHFKTGSIVTSGEIAIYAQKWQFSGLEFRQKTMNDAITHSALCVPFTICDSTCVITYNNTGEILTSSYYHY